MTKAYRRRQQPVATAGSVGGFAELDEVTLTMPVYVEAVGRELPAGSHGTVVGIWQDGQAYEVEFTRPFTCLATVLPEGLAA